MQPRGAHRRLWNDLAWIVVCAAILLGVGGESHAKSHLWRFTEFFSDATGEVQFIEMFVFDPAGTAETKFQGFPLSSSANTYVFTHNLPNENTFHRWVLIATQAFADLPGAPTPDYIIPEGFFEPDGDQIVYRNGLDVFSFSTGQMPTDGLHALLPDTSTPVNSPTNFAGDTATIVVPVPLPTLQPWALATLVLLIVGMTIYMFDTYRRRIDQ